MHALVPQFKDALSLLEIDPDRRQIAIDAHAEIRELLEKDEQLGAWGVDTVLIGSYARHTAINSGKDVDVFTKLAKLRVDDVDPRTIFEHVRDLLVDSYGDRAEPQQRSVEISFDEDDFEFSVDVVSAVRMGDRWAIPRHDTSTWDDPDERWVETDPEHLGDLTEERNKRSKVGSQGAYVPTVKLIRQTRRHHRGKARPGGFYFELITYWAFERGEVSGSTFAEIFASALASVAVQLSSDEELVDPVLGEAYKPAPEPSDRADAAAAFKALEAQAQEAIDTDDRCKAGALWRGILGQNEQEWCFPVPDGCDDQGRALPVTAVGTSRGSREPGGFA